MWDDAPADPSRRVPSTLVGTAGLTHESPRGDNFGVSWCPALRKSGRKSPLLRSRCASAAHSTTVGKNSFARSAVVSGKFAVADIIKIHQFARITLNTFGVFGAFVVGSFFVAACS